MKQLLLIATLFVGSMSFSQGMGDVTIYSNTGNKFYVILNGVRQNMQPETNVKVTGLTNEWYDCKIMSANNNFTIEKKIIVKYDTLITYAIKEKKGKYKMRFLSETPLGTSTATPDQTVVTYHATEEPVNNRTESTNTNVNTNAELTNTNVNNTTAGSTTTTTTTTTSSTTTDARNNGSAGETESVNISMNVNENGMGADVNVSVNGTQDPNSSSTNMSTDVNSTSTTTTTTTTSSSSSDGNSTYYEESTTTTTSGTNNGTTQYDETTSTTVTTNTDIRGNSTDDRTMYEDEDMTVAINNSCYITDNEVDDLAKQVANESFADDQSRIANMAAENKCMSTEQITKVANSFTFEDNKLEFLKKAYTNCTDQGNYYKVMETLTFSGDKEELQNYINSTK